MGNISKTQKILVVDNDLMLLDIISDAFNKEEYTVRTALDGKEALDEIKKNPPDILFTDIVMPKISGDLLIQYVRKNEQYALMTIVVISGAINEYLSRKDLAADYYIEKSDIVTLQSRIKEICRQIREREIQAPPIIPSMEGRRRKIVEELLVSQQQIQQMLTELRAGLIVYDYDYRILDVNPAAEIFLEKSKNNLLGTFVRDHFDPLNCHGIDAFLSRRHHDQPNGEGLTIALGDRMLDLHFSALQDNADGSGRGGLVLLYDLTRQKMAEAKLKKRVKELDMLNQIAHQFNSSISHETVFNRLLAKSVDLLGAEAGTVALIESGDRGDPELVFAYTCGEVAEETLGKRLNLNEGLIGWVVTNEEAVIVRNVFEDKRFFGNIDQHSGFKTDSILCSPIKSGEQVVGAIELLNKRDGRFNKENLTLLNTIVDLAALSIRNSFLHKDIVKQRNYYSGIMESLNEGLLVIDSELIIQDVNRFFLEFFNRNRDEIVGSKYYSLFYPEGIKDTESLFGQVGVFDTGKDFSVNRTFRNHQSDLCHFIVSGTPLERSDGCVTSMLVTFSDVTRLEKFHGYLKSSAEVASLLLKREAVRERVADVLEIMGRAAGADRSCWIENQTDASGKLSGHLRDQWYLENVCGRAHCDAFSKMDYNGVFARWFAELSAGRIVAGPVVDLPENEREVLRRPESRNILVIPLLVKGSFRGFIEFENSDVQKIWQDPEINLLRSAVDSLAKAFEHEKTQQDKITLQEQLKHSQKMQFMGEISSGISHNFRNILAGIMTSLQLIQLQYPDDPNLQKYAAGMIDLARNGNDMIGGLLKFARKESDRRKSVFNLADALEDTFRIILTAFDQKIKIRKKWPGKLPFEGDRAELSQVFMNLAANAKDAMPEGGLLRITADATNGKLIVSFSDNGCGMDEKTVKRVFDPFFTSKEPGRGTGLGLSIAYGIVKNHGGDLTVRSTPGEGTTFTILLPRPSVEETIGNTMQAAARIIGCGQKILIVDDDQGIVEPLSILLDTMGYSVSAAKSGIEALDKYQAIRPDVVLMDRNMPGMDGQVAIEHLLELDSSARIVILSGYESDGFDGIDDRIAARIKGYVTKPFEVDELTRMLTEVMDK